jgi:hypothetical protein
LWRSVAATHARYVKTPNGAAGCCAARFAPFAFSIVAHLSRRSETISDALSILDAREISRFRFREAVEAVAETFGPPFFERSAMFAPQGSTVTSSPRQMASRLH